MLDFKNEVEKIDGWLTEDEGIFLYESAKKVKQENAIVEIGSWKGRSTICLGKGVRDGNQATVYAMCSNKFRSAYIWFERFRLSPESFANAQDFRYTQTLDINSNYCNS